jgi:uncharacterized membrane protein YbhN (UPF0104 family)
MLCKTGLSVLLIWWVAGSIDLGRLRMTVAELGPMSVALAAVLVTVQTVILGWRWHRIVQFLGVSLPLGKAIHWVFVGLFFNQALPSSVGGDVVRAWNLHRHGSTPGVAFGSVAIERGTGVALLGLLVTLCLPSIWIELDNSALRGVLFAVGPCLLVGLVVLGVVYKTVAAWLPGRLATLATGLGDGLGQLGANPRVLIEVSCLGIAASLTGILAAYGLGLDLDIGLTFPAYVVLVGGATLFSVLPISLGGWGVREVGMVALFGAVGVAPERALTLSILCGFLPLLISLPGGLSWWVGAAPDKAGGR